MPVCYLKQKHMINKQLITRRFSRAVAEAGRCVQSFDVDAISVSQPKYWDVSFEELVARVRKSNVESLD